VSVGAFAGLNMSTATGDSNQNVTENWQLLSNAFAIAGDDFFLLHQVHQDHVLVIDQPHEKPFGAPPAYDAVITDQPDVALCIKTADCVPVFLVDPERRVIANIHAGWKGTALNIAGKVIATMAERFGSRVEKMLAVIGPAIGSCCYEVDEPVISAMGPWGKDIKICRSVPGQDRWMLDLPLINRRQMIHSGIRERNMTAIDLCTSCREDLFYSHRRDRGKTGRQVHFIMLHNMKNPIAKILDNHRCLL
jgi:polyphenol oxidase